MYQPMFVPPRHNRVLLWLANKLLPTLAPVLGNVRDVRVAEEDFARLEALREHRAILSPNHPTGDDPVVPFWLSRRLGQPFFYLAAREVLEGFKGRFLNQLGTYSVIRGVPDRESLRCTRRLLAEQDRKVVIFPEGEIDEHNDRLLAFQSGVAQIGFWALDDLEKACRDPRLPVLPLAIKYRVCESPRPAIENSLQALESALHLSPASKLTAYQRLHRVGERVLTTLERAEGLKSGEPADLSGRIQAVRQATLDRVAHAIGTDVDRRQAPADQLHLLYNALKQWVGLPPDDASEYDLRLYARRVETAAPLYCDLQRLQNFIVVSGDYVASEPSAERFLEVLGRLEKEVLGRVVHRVPREALVRIAPPIRLEERYAEYRKNKREVVAAVTREMEETIRGMLQELSRERTPITLDH